jgi:hypothetical protein
MRFVNMSALQLAIGILGIVVVANFRLASAQMGKTCHEQKSDRIYECGQVRLACVFACNYESSCLDGCEAADDACLKEATAAFDVCYANLQASRQKAAESEGKPAATAEPTLAAEPTPTAKPAPTPAVTEEPAQSEDDIAVEEFTEKWQNLSAEEFKNYLAQFSEEQLETLLDSNTLKDQFADFMDYIRAWNRVHEVEEYRDKARRFAEGSADKISSYIFDHNDKLTAWQREVLLDVLDENRQGLARAGEGAQVRPDLAEQAKQEFIADRSQAQQALADRTGPVVDTSAATIDSVRAVSREQYTVEPAGAPPDLSGLVPSGTDGFGLRPEVGRIVGFEGNVVKRHHLPDGTTYDLELTTVSNRIRGAVVSTGDQLIIDGEGMVEYIGADGSIRQYMTPGYAAQQNLGSQTELGQALEVIKKPADPPPPPSTIPEPVLNFMNWIEEVISPEPSWEGPYGVTGVKG